MKSKHGGRGLAGALLVSGALLASCGGGETRNSFRPARVIAFGDETSVIVDVDNDGNGAKYTINGVVSVGDSTRVCGANPIWIQSVAIGYGLVFPECNPSAAVLGNPPSRIRATVGAQAADLAAQIGAQQAESGIGEGDLVTVLVGENDIINQYQRYPSVSETELTANVEAAGAEAGRQVNRLADLGAKVLLATPFDASLTPFGRNEQATNADTDRAALLSRLSVRYNAALRGTISNDGRRIGLVLFDEQISALVKFPGLDGFTNVTDAACDLTLSAYVPASILDCTTLTLVPNASVSFLWADDRHVGPNAQGLLGSGALSRAQNNPF